MPDDVNIGRLVAEIALDSSKLESDSQRSQEALEEIRYTLQHLGTDSSETEDILKQCFSDTSKVEGYIGKMDIISAKMDNYREKLKRIQEQEANDRQYWNTLNQSGGRNSSFVNRISESRAAMNLIACSSSRKSMLISSRCGLSFLLTSLQGLLVTYFV